MLDRVKKILGIGARKTGNKLVVSVEKLERRVALLENGRLEEYSVERSGSRNIVGCVYKGRVKNIEMGLKAMFVDIGTAQNLRRGAAHRIMPLLGRTEIDARNAECVDRQFLARRDLAFEVDELAIRIG